MGKLVGKIDVFLIPDEIVASVEDEDTLAELSKMDSIYAIRKLKATVHYSTSLIRNVPLDVHGQIYLEEFSIWLQSNMYEEH